jgi:hypothetical protein
VIYRLIAELKFNPKNPRTHSRRQIQQIKRSLKAFGFVVPVLIDARGNVIAGHGRILAALLLGLTEVPTICLDHLTAAQAQAFMIADNRLTENSEWNERLLAEQLHDLSFVDLGFSLDVIGFETAEIDLKIEGLNSPAADTDDPSDALPAQSQGPVVSRPGDLWLLDRNRVLCDCALNPGAYSTLMSEELAQASFTDPPFNLPIENHVSGLGAIQHKNFTMASGEMSQAEFTSFLIRACSLHARHSVNGSLHFICMDWRHLMELLTAGNSVYSELKNLCVWKKDAAGMGSLYRSQHELILVFKHGDAPHRNNVQLGKYGRNRSNVWSYPSAKSFSRASDEGNLLSKHPTVKPAAMVADAIMDCTARDDIVLDGFLGAGTTVIAAERTGRRCYGLEIDPLYVDVIVRRWQAFTRSAARHAASGETFDEVQAAREAK